MPGPSRPIIRVVPLPALRAGVTTHVLHYARVVLALTLNPLCRSVFVSCFLVPFSVPPIWLGPFGHLYVDLQSLVWLSCWQLKLAALQLSWLTGSAWCQPINKRNVKINLNEDPVYPNTKFNFSYRSDSCTSIGHYGSCCPFNLISVPHMSWGCPKCLNSWITESYVHKFIRE